MEEAIDHCSMIETLFPVSCATLRFDTILSPPSPAYDPTITAFGYNLAQAPILQAQVAETERRKAGRVQTHNIAQVRGRLCM